MKTLQIGGILCVAMLMALTLLVMNKRTDALEMDWVRWAIATRGPQVTAIIQVITFLTSATPALVFCVGAGIFDWRVRRDSLWRLAWPVLAFCGALGSNIALRVLIGRLRPQVEYIPNQFPELTASFQKFSFPSGHAGSATIACFCWVAVLWCFRRVRWIALALALLIWLGSGFGRFYLGVHWPTDVVGGYALAGAWLCAVLVWLRQRISNG
jgi:undecaprenyl-diphosphatase